MDRDPPLARPPGEAYFINNYTILHARTAFDDGDAPEDARRHLLRLWLDARIRPVHPYICSRGILPVAGRTPSFDWSGITAVRRLKREFEHQFRSLCHRLERVNDGAFRRSHRPPGRCLTSLDVGAHIARRYLAFDIRIHRDAIRRVRQFARLLLATPVADIAAVERRKHIGVLRQQRIVHRNGAGQPGHTAARQRVAQAQETNQVARIRVRRQFLLVAVGARPRVLSAEILDVSEPVAHDALRQAASEMRADAPENQAEIVFRVILDGQPAQQHEAAPVRDLPADFLHNWAQRGHLEMLALQPVEADPSRFDAPHGSSDVAQLRRVEVDRVIRRRAEIGDRPGARVPDQRGEDRGRRRVAVLRYTRLKDCRHCSGLLLFRRICTRNGLRSTWPLSP
jgi:hypothetical protein